MLQRIILFFIVLGFVINSNAQSSVDLKSLPKGVKMNFEVMYPKQKADWAKDTAGWYEAKFKKAGTTTYVRYTKQGYWMNAMEELALDKLPESLKLSIKDDWGLKMVASKKGSSPYYKELYELTLLKDNKPIRKFFTAEGVMVAD